MIDLAEEMEPNGFDEEPLDFGFLQRPSSGAATVRVDRPGSRMKATFSFPPYEPDVARRILPRLKRALREGVRIRWPLLGVNQGLPGNPVVDGDEVAGTTLPLRGLTPFYAAKTGFALHIEEALTGERHWHEVQEPAVANADGKIELLVEPPLRAPFADGDVVELARPTFEGWLLEPVGRSVSVDRLARGIVLTIEEAC